METKGFPTTLNCMPEQKKHCLKFRLAVTVFNTWKLNQANETNDQLCLDQVIEMSIPLIGCLFYRFIVLLYIYKIFLHTFHPV